MDQSADGSQAQGTDWMTPQSKTISSDEKQTGVAWAGKEGRLVARAQGAFWGAGQAQWLHDGGTHGYIYLSELIHLYPSNRLIQFCVNYLLVKLIFKNHKQIRNKLC